MPILLDLFLTFLKIGAVSFGGGYAMIPMVTEEVISHGWLTETEVLNFIAVSESTPGPIAINMATFVGASKGGILGAMLSTLGVVTPSFIIILLVASVLKRLLKFEGVNAFLTGVRPVVTGLIVGTGITLLLTVMFSISTINGGYSFDYKALIIFSIIAVIYFAYLLIKKRTEKGTKDELKEKTKEPKKERKGGISPIILIGISALLGVFFYGVI